MDDGLVSMNGCESYGGYQYLYGVNYDQSATGPDGNICRAKFKEDVAGWHRVDTEDDLWWDRFGNP